jgi:plastocyanin domain-containing protein
MRAWSLIAGLGACLGACVSPAVSGVKAEGGPSRRISLEVTVEGFVPDSIPVKVGTPVTLVVTRTTDETCATDLLIEGTDLKVALPLNAPVEVSYTPPRAGQVKFGCAMGMMVSGVLLVE